MEPRTATIERNTHETRVKLALNLDGVGQATIDTSIGFLDHMLDQVAVHGLFDLTVQAEGDRNIDTHHTIEDVAITFGQALNLALGDRAGIIRMGAAYVPMDESLARVVVDLSGRPYAAFGAEWSAPMIGAMPTSLIEHVFESIAFNGRLNLHAQVLYGRDDHHQAEALFKGLGRALAEAVKMDPRRSGIPSTKGTLTA